MDINCPECGNAHLLLQRTLHQDDGIDDEAQENYICGNLDCQASITVTYDLNVQSVEADE